MDNLTGRFKQAPTLSEKAPVKFLGEVIIRTPRLPFQQTFSEKEIDALLQDEGFLESVYIASPVLYDEIQKLNEGKLEKERDRKKIIDSIVKYYTRSCSRCTPFGLFSTCAVGTWRPEKTSLKFEADDIHRHTRLDMYYLCHLSQQLARLPFIKERLLFFSNSSYYVIGDEIRYIEYKYIKDKRHYRVSAIQHTDYLEKLLRCAGEGATMGQLCLFLAREEGIPPEDASSYIRQLIDAQLLVAELEPAVTGEEFIYQIIAILRKINAQEPLAQITAIINFLVEIDQHIQQLDANKGNSVQSYKNIINTITKLNIPFEEGKLFQVDAFRKSTSFTVNENLQQNLLSALEILDSLKMYGAAEGQHMADFKRKFYERYEDEAIPLVLALDNESGVGYPVHKTSSFAPVVDDLVFPRKGEEALPEEKRTPDRKWLLSRLIQCLEEGRQELVLDEKEIEQQQHSWEHLPPSLSALFSIIDPDTNLIQLKGFIGASALSMIGRFAHGDKAVEKLAAAIASAEEEQHKDILFAEIVHIPDNRTSNVMLHPAFRGFEIPYLAQSSLSPACRININDLYIRIVNQQVQLFSKRLNKRIIPRLSNMHNYSFKSLPVYHFLCDMQQCSLKTNFSFSWGRLQQYYKFLPRVRYRNVILSSAYWVFEKKDVAHLLNAAFQELPDHIRCFREKWRLPERVVLADGDNELLIDFNNLPTVQAWLKTIKERPSFILKEFLIDAVKYTVNECVASLVKTAPAYTGTTSKVATELFTRRNFTIGSDWLYYKLYCGPSSADRILINQITPVIEQLITHKLIDKWFFIRYLDPDFHLRIRFHLTNVEHTGAIARIMADNLRTAENQGVVWRTQTDTYKREVERYGGEEAIELSETLFFHDSQATLCLINMLQGDEKETIKWLWAVKSADELMNDFGLTLTEKLNITRTYRDLFSKEAGMNKDLRQQINRKYTHYAPLVSEIMDHNTSTNRFKPILELLQARSNHIMPLAEEMLTLSRQQRLLADVSHLLGSYIHMMLNRLVSHKPRVHELLMYDFLCRYYEREKHTGANRGRPAEIVK